MEVHHVAREISVAQQGLVLVQQLRRAGATNKAVACLVASGEYVRETSLLLRVAGAPSTPDQRALAGVLDAGQGAALSHRSAAAWWGVPGFFVEPVEVSRTRDGTSSSGRLATVHEHVLLPEHHVTEVHGVRVTKPARVLFELCYLATRHQLHPMKAMRAGDRLWTDDLTRRDDYVNMLDELAQRGRPGITLYRQFLAERGEDYVPPASGLESRFMWLMRKYGERPMERQRNLGDASDWIGRVDFYDPLFRLIVEIYSQRWHAGLEDRIHDRARLARLEAAGFRVRVVWDHELWWRPEVVIRRVRDARSGAESRPSRGEIRPENR